MLITILLVAAVVALALAAFNINGSPKVNLLGVGLALYVAAELIAHTYGHP